VCWGTQGPGKAVTPGKFTEPIHSQGFSSEEHQALSLPGLSLKQRNLLCAQEQGGL